MKQRPASPADSLVLTVPEVARVLAISESLTWSLISKGQLPCVRCGRSVRVPRAAIECLVDEATGKTGLPR